MMTGKPSKVGQGDVVFGVASGFVSRSVHARLQTVCVHRLRFMPPWLTSRQTHRQTDKQHLTSLTK